MLIVFQGDINSCFYRFMIYLVDKNYFDLQTLFYSAEVKTFDNQKVFSFYCDIIPAKRKSYKELRTVWKSGIE